MLSFIDPVMYASTPDNPNTMGMAITLTEPVDGQLLAEAIEDTRERFPYFYVRPQVKDADLIVVPNELPMVVRDIWAPTKLASASVNYHIAAWKFEGKRLAVEAMHVISDGSGFIPYVKSVLFTYLSRKLGIEFDRTGFKLPGDVIPESEIGDPFSQEQIDAIEAPFYKKAQVKDFAQVKEPDASWRAFCIKLPEKDVIKYCGELDASPNALISVLLARAMHRVQPTDDRVILGGIAVNYKAILGNFDNYRGFSNLAYISFPPKNLGKDLSLLCTTPRGQIMLQAMPENVLFELKEMKKGMEMLHSIPSIEAKMLMIGHEAGHKRTSFTVSYANSRSFGPLDPYIEEIYAMAEPTSSSIVCEITCINHTFFLHFEQCFESEAIFDAFMEELRAVGISAELIRKENFQVSSVSYDGLDFSILNSLLSAVGGLAKMIGA